jgi:hypothetical protein
MVVYLQLLYINVHPWSASEPATPVESTASESTSKKVRSPEDAQFYCKMQWLKGQKKVGDMSKD